MRCIGALKGMYSYDISMKMWCTYLKTPCMICNQMTMKCNEMYICLILMRCDVWYRKNDMHDTPLR